MSDDDVPGLAKGPLLIVMSLVAVIAGGWTWFKWDSMSFAGLVILWSSAVLLGVLLYLWLLARRQHRLLEQARIQANNHNGAEH